MMRATTCIDFKSVLAKQIDITYRYIIDIVSALKFFLFLVIKSYFTKSNNEK